MATRRTPRRRTADPFWARGYLPRPFPCRRGIALPDRSDTDDRVVVATIGAPHGVRGEVRLKPWTDDPLAIRDYAPLTLADGRALTLLSARAQKNMLVCRFGELRNREDAAALTNHDLLAPRSAMPEPEEDEFFLDDLIGMKAVDANGAAHGEVIAVHDFGAGDILELKPERGRSVMIPFSEAAVPAIDVDAGTLTVEPVAAGLVDAEPEGDGAPKAK